MTPADVFSRDMPKSFADRLAVGAFWEGYVASCLALNGLHTLHNPAVVGGERDHSISHDLDVFANNPFEPGTFTDESCLRERRGGDKEGVTKAQTQLEVKSSKLTFTGPLNYPNITATVCAQESWMNKWPGKETVQRDFILVSRVTGSMVWVPVGAKVQMNHMVHDMVRNYTYKCVIVGREQLRTFQEYVAKVKGYEKN